MAIHKITLPTPFAVGPVNLYLIEGEPLTLIDAGPLTDEALQLLESELYVRGYALGDLQRIIITHTHPDHFGLTRTLVDRSGATVWTHPYNADWFNDLDAAMQRRARFSQQVFQQAAVPEPMLQSMASFSTRSARMFEATPVSHWLEEGDRVEMDGADWTVLHTPGHASGHISLYQPESGRMMVGDHLLKHISSNPLLEAPRRHGQPRDKSLLQYIESMQRVAAMDVGEAYPGHGENIADHRALIAGRLRFHEQRMERIAGLLEGGPSTAYELMRQLFPNLSSFEVFLGLSEVIGHLDLLEQQERVAALPENGHLLYALNQ